MCTGTKLAGTLEMELTSADIEAALAAVNAEGIALNRLEREGELTCRFSISRRDQDALSALCDRRGESLKVVRKKGVYWTARKLRNRPLLLAGLLFLLALVLMLPTRIYFVRVEGNDSIPDAQILAAAEECGITFGASRREVRSERMKNALLSAVPQLQWAGVNTYGCVAVISVREGPRQETDIKEKEVTRIVAARDGYILSGTVTKGNGLFQVGQTVKEGQVLISGYTDCGLYIQAGRAEGEIIAQTNHELTAVTPAEGEYKGAILEVKRKYSLIFRKKRINLWIDSGISGSSCGRMYKEYYMTLPGGFQLPAALCVEEYVVYQMDRQMIPQEDAERVLSEFAGNYVLRQMIAGEINSKVETIVLQNGVYRLSGKYICSEMISREQQEQIGDINGKNG